MDVILILRVLLALALASAAAVNAIGPGFVHEEFDRWGYPGWLPAAVALWEAVAAVVLCTPFFRWGAAFALIVLAGVYVSLVRSREWLRLQYPALLGALAILALLS
jgi:hypothetical protein